MDTLQIVVNGIEENKGYYINGKLFQDWSSQDSKFELETLLVNIMLKFDIQKVEWYGMTDIGNELFYENEYNFLDEFDEYPDNSLRFMIKKDRIG